ncbi:MAG TPA: hypothetical protein VGP70_25095 [Actinomadura sp.]|jgi:hypothetical protein|nr:hypothetical protein [Actinomadura sp.]
MSHTGMGRPKIPPKKSLATDFKKSSKTSGKKEPSRTRKAREVKDADSGSLPTGGGGLGVKTRGNNTPTKTTTVPGTEVDTTPTVDLMETDRPHPTTWKIARHELTAGQKVKLSPHIKLKDGKIARMAAGRMRTPSPFGARMGDHTIAWTAVVDDVHALVFGKTLEDAYKALADRQMSAQTWMSDNDSVLARLWDTLPEAERNMRRPVLETYAAEVRDALQGQATAEGLAKAIAHHLAFVNFLPYATVPAKGAVGSKGSGEGPARTAVLALDLEVENAKKRAEETPQQKALRLKREKAAQDWAAEVEKLKVAEENDPKVTARRHEKEAQVKAQRQAAVVPNAREGLWKLLSLDAIAREAHLDRVIAPTRHEKFVQKVKDSKEIADDAVKLSAAFSVSVDMVKAAVAKTDATPSRKRKKPPGGLTPTGRPRKRRKTTPKTVKQERRKSTPKFDPAVGLLQFGRDLQAVENAAVALGDLRQSGHDVLPDLQADVNGLLRETTQALGTKTLQVGATKKVIALNGKIDAHRDKIDTLLADLEGDPTAVEDEAALMLGYLLHDHQETVARTYPVAVNKTEFLGDDPATAAIAALKTFLLAKAGEEQDKERAKAQREGRTPPTELFVEPKALERLLGKVEKVHRQLGAIRKPASGEANRWVGVARTADVVVTFPADNSVTIQGRAAAPNGVAGMGSHTTAWVTEVMAVERLVQEYGKGGIIERLRDETLKDLEGDLMTKLAAQLPVEQLEGDQLSDVFNAALEVMEATSPEDAVIAYLSFRNLLPYATVDAGNRDGQGERRNGTLQELFDKDSLNDAIEQKLDELKPENIKGTADALRGSATVLREVLDSTKPPNPAPVGGITWPVLPGPAPAAELVPPSWNTHQRLKAAVENTITALNTHAGELDDARKKGDVHRNAARQAISVTRFQEHTRIYNYARYV